MTMEITSSSSSPFRRMMSNIGIVATVIMSLMLHCVSINYDTKKIGGASGSSSLLATRKVMTVSPQQQKGYLQEDDERHNHHDEQQQHDDETQQLSASSSSNDTTTEDDIHSTNIAVLELLDWEVVSLMDKSKNHCPTAPPGIDEECCLGTTSHASQIKVERRRFCSHVTLDDYQQLYDQAKQHLMNGNTPSSDQQCDVCRMVELLRRHKLKSFWGDSVSNQVEQGLTCELQRRNYSVTRQNIPFDGRRGDGYRSMIEFRRRRVRSPLWKDDEVILDFIFQYRLPFLVPEERDRIAHDYDVLITNVGLHWVHTPDPKNKKEVKRWNKDTYPRMLTKFYEYIQQVGKVKLLAHRETSATHFQGPGGDYSLARFRPDFNVSTCGPHNNNNNNNNSSSLIDGKWRETAIIQAAQAANYSVIPTGSYMPPKQQQQPRQQELYTIPFYDFTAPQHNLHPRREKPGSSLDCTHFCSSPFLFQPIWRGIRLAMDREFGGVEVPQIQNEGATTTKKSGWMKGV